MLQMLSALPPPLPSKQPRFYPNGWLTNAPALSPSLSAHPCQPPSNHTSTSASTRGSSPVLESPSVARLFHCLSSQTVHRSKDKAMRICKEL